MTNESSDQGSRLPDSASLRDSVSKWIAGVFSILMVGAVLSPAVQNWRNPPVDSFPLSYYPMFTEKRDETSRVTYIVGIDAEGKRHRINYKYAAGDAGGGGLNQVRRQMGKMISRGESEKLCKTIARNLARKQSGPLRRVVSVELRTDTYDLNDYFTGKSKVPVREKIHATCSVNRNQK